MLRNAGKAFDEIHDKKNQQTKLRSKLPVQRVIFLESQSMEIVPLLLLLWTDFGTITNVK